MTPARQERKSPRFWALFAAAMGIFCGLGGVAAGGAATEWVVVNRHTGLAIDGFDPVSYFVDGAPKFGRADLELPFAGATWRFRNEGNRSAFAAAPEVYAPRFGGHDPVAMARGVATAGNPALWLIVQKRLYFFYSAEARTAFSRDPEKIVGDAEQNWNEVRQTLVRS
jgi:YHS domain-containing protein